jgi:hypothetical protein
LTHRRKLRLALILLAGFHAMVLFAGFFAPYDYATQVRDRPFAEPAQIHFIDRSGRFHLRPFISVQQDASSREVDAS